MKIPEKVFYLVIIVLLVSIGAVGWLYRGKVSKVEEQEKLIVALHDTLKISTNEKGEQVAKIQQIQTSRVKDFTTIKNLTGENKKLQDLVKENKNRLGDNGSVTTFSSNTKVDVVVPTTIKPQPLSPIGSGMISVLPKNNRDTLYLYPEYTAKVELGKWVKADITANKDSTRMKLGVYNEYKLVIGEEGKLFGKKTPFGEVTNLNPYSTTATLKTYQVTNTIKQKRLSLGVQTGYAPLTKQTYVGVGLSYSLIRLF